MYSSESSGGGEKISRRKFLKLAVGATASLAFTGVVSDSCEKEQEQEKGINYSTGMKFHPEHKVDYEAINSETEKDLESIKEMGCTSVRVYGDNSANLIKAAEIALQKDLKVWFSPRLINGNKEETLNLVVNMAQEAEKLRQKYGDKIVFVVGNELMLDSTAIFEEKGYADRISRFKKFKALEMAKGYLNFLKMKTSSPDVQKFQERVREFTRNLALAAKKEFKGKITYASLPDENVDWNSFDIVGVNLYEDISNKDEYEQKLEDYKQHGKPVAITEYGTAPYKGADRFGGAAHSVIDWEKGEIGNMLGLLPVVRDEEAQADYLERLIGLYRKHKIDAHFIFEYVDWNTQHRPNDPKKDLSTGSFGVVKWTKPGERIESSASQKIESLFKE
ncbi:MAG: Abortive infection protein [Candidatus Magasanikbacteria bacterium GW2011_GWC2_37_14]|uniref:Abortive infection protein n=1 Tax=Candidatus Magasanikbacteria bacterium GW2011_GWC2_37_14 TaxID=1619046 RepID=A0A0G0GPY0_9BACT|nr:MAG: Abortive infection protein [Candidatus Magasanikbacteria bacterium GW2011_GWC2_37_14]